MVDLDVLYDPYYDEDGYWNEDRYNEEYERASSFVRTKNWEMKGNIKIHLSKMEPRHIKNVINMMVKGRIFSGIKSSELWDEVFQTLLNELVRRSQ